MQYRKFGKTGCKVSTLGFGCMRLPHLDNDLGKIDVPATTKLLRTAVNLGVNYVDTAYVYHKGQSEPVMGAIIEDLGLRSQLYLATKMPVWEIKSRADMERVFDEQCARLRTDYIDFYLLHSLNKSWWPQVREAGALEFLDDMRKQGRIRHCGFSFHDDLGLFKEIVDAHPWEFCQIQYNYLDEALQAGTEGLMYAAERGLGVVVMEPLRGGNLAQTPPADIQAVWDATAFKRSPADWALRWLLHHKEVSVILSGMNDEAQLTENAAVCADQLPHALSPAEQEALDSVAKLYATRFQVPCTGCAYCMPCPSGVSIPAIFNVYNQYGLFGNKQWCGAMYNFALSATEKADQCVECGQCQEACPQHIEIIEKLKEAHKVLTDCGFPA